MVPSVEEVDELFIDVPEIAGHIFVDTFNKLEYVGSKVRVIVVGLVIDRTLVDQTI